MDAVAGVAKQINPQRNHTPSLTMLRDPIIELEAVGIDVPLCLRADIYTREATQVAQEKDVKAFTALLVTGCDMCKEMHFAGQAGDETWFNVRFKIVLKCLTQALKDFRDKALVTSFSVQVPTDMLLLTTLIKGLA